MNRTDLVDTTFKDYAAEFEKQYPGTTVKFEALTDYEGDAKIRLNSKDYGDVLLIPSSNVTKDQYANFFEPLGSTEEQSKTYRFANEASFDGTAYGVSTFGSAMGYVFNRDVWTKAGITEPPATEEEYLAALEKIKANGSIPYYTNYKDGWPLATIEGNLGTVQGEDVRTEMIADDAPWTEGNDQYNIDGLLYDTVAAGLSEDDPTTTNWEESKDLLAQGEIGSMVLGSWAVSQMQDAAEKALSALPVRQQRTARVDESYKEKFRQAIPHLKTVAQRDPTDVQSWDTLGRIYSQLGMTKEAEDAFKRAGMR